MELLTQYNIPSSGSWDAPSAVASENARSATLPVLHWPCTTFLGRCSLTTSLTAHMSSLLERFRTTTKPRSLENVPLELRHGEACQSLRHHPTTPPRALVLTVLTVQNKRITKVSVAGSNRFATVDVSNRTSVRRIWQFVFVSALVLWAGPN